MTNDRMQMIGIYPLHRAEMTDGTGFDAHVIEECLRELIDEGFCLYDQETGFVWVIDMALSQVSENPNESQRKGILSELARLHLENDCRYVHNFLERYRKQYPFLPSSTEEISF